MVLEQSLPVPPARTRAIAFLTLTVALLAISCAPIFIRLCETDLGPNGTVFNRMALFFVVFGLGRWLGRLRHPAADVVTSPNGQLAANESGSTESGESESSESESTSIAAKFPWLLASVGVISIISLGLWAVSLQYTTVAKSMLLNNLTPIFTSLGSWLWFGRRFDRRFLAGMTLALAGAIGLGLEDLHGAEGSLMGDAYALLSAVFLGGYFLVVERLRSRYDATTILLWRCAVGSALLLPVVLLLEGQLFPTTAVAWMAAIGLGLVSEGLGQRLLAESMIYFSCSFISIFLLLEPIVSALLAWGLFLEQLSPVTWIGFAVVLSGVYLAQSSQAAESRSTDPAPDLAEARA